MTSYAAWDNPEHRFVMRLAVDETEPPHNVEEQARELEQIFQDKGWVLGEWIAFTEFLSWRARNKFIRAAKEAPATRARFETQVAQFEALQP